MSVYKVPQDVEADDKIIGPFTFRQFIYLIIVVLATGLAWVLGGLFLPLAIIPVPVIAFFGALALPLKKDQPMEVFMAAIVSFYLKPRRRLWDPDGIESLIEITAPKTTEIQRVKNISQQEAKQRLSYLSSVIDSQGMSVRGFGVEESGGSLQSNIYFEAQQTEDPLDTEAEINKRFDSKLQKSKDEQRETMSRIITGEIETPNYFNNQDNSSGLETNDLANLQDTRPYQEDDNNLEEENTEDNFNPNNKTPDITEEPNPSNIIYNPYPEIQQSVIQPIGEQNQAKVDESLKKASKPSDELGEHIEHKPSQKDPLPDIINLATNDDLSIATIAREANRIHEKQNLEEEVVISLR